MVVLAGLLGCEAGACASSRAGCAVSPAAVSVRLLPDTRWAVGPTPGAGHELTGRGAAALCPAAALVLNTVSADAWMALIPCTHSITSALK